MRSLALLALLLGSLAASCAGSGRDPHADDDDTVSPSPTGSAEPTPTIPGETFVRFAAVGDVGTGEDGEHLVADAIRAKCEIDGCDFLMLLGDNVYPSGVTSVDDEDWVAAIEEPYESLGIPIRPVLGNHDYGSNGDDFERARAMVERGAVDPLWEMPMERYVVETDTIAIVVLDTNALFFDHDDYLPEQREFVAWALDEVEDVPWKLAAGHHPYRSNGNHGNAGSYDGEPGMGEKIRALYESAVCGRVDLMLTAHDHSRQILPGDATCPTPVVVSGAGAETGTLPGDQPMDFGAETLGFTYVVASPSALRLEMVGADGTVEYTLSLSR